MSTITGISVSGGTVVLSSAARQSQQSAFRQQLTNQPQSAGAHRRANGNFSLPSCCFGQQQVGNIDARHQQHQTYERTPVGLLNPQVSMEQICQLAFRSRNLVLHLVQCVARRSCLRPGRY